MPPCVGRLFCGLGDAGAPRWAVPTPGARGVSPHFSRLSWFPSVMVYARGSKGTAGAPRPRPSPEGCISLWTPIRGGSGCVEGTARGGRAALAGVTVRGLRPFSLGAARRGACGAPPIRHGSCRDTFPSGEGWAVPTPGSRLGWFSSVILRARAAVPSVMVEGGGDLLRRPTESTHAPPAMHRVRRTVPCLYCQATSPATGTVAATAHHLARNEGDPRAARSPADE